MIRVAMAIAMVWIALAQPAAARARSASPRWSSDALPNAPAMCGDSAQPLRLDTLVPAVVSDAPPSRPLPNDAEGQPAWCASPDDPRCAPRDTGSPRQTQSLSAPLCAFAGERWPALQGTEVTSTLRCAQLGAARLGVHSFVERPPRG